jgi:xanthine dehydrogenase YagT iron-sulfur-binding subunit
MPRENNPSPPQSPKGVSRRLFLKQAGMTSLALAAPTLPALLGAPSPTARPEAMNSGKIPVTLTINGQPRHLEIEPRAVLLDVIRDQLALPGTKKGCDHGQCGSCTILINGRRVVSCLTLATTHDGADITTIEGLEKNGELHPMQTAFLDCDAFQCGACTPGQIMSAVGLLSEPIGTDDASVRESMSGNICRCGAYKNILTAVQRARAQAPA